MVAAYTSAIYLNNHIKKEAKATIKPGVKRCDFGLGGRGIYKVRGAGHAPCGLQGVGGGMAGESIKSHPSDGCRAQVSKKEDPAAWKQNKRRQENIRTETAGRQYQDRKSCNGDHDQGRSDKTNSTKEKHLIFHPTGCTWGGMKSREWIE